MMFMWPQVIRVLRKKTVEGISVVGTLHSFTGALLWTIYGVVASIPSVALANVVALVALVFIIAAQVRYGVVSLRVVIVGQLIVALFGLVAAAISMTFIGVIAVVIGGTAIIPQTIRSARTSHQVGVSAPTYGMIAVTSASWAIYGAMLGDTFVMAPNFLIVPCALFISFRAVISHRRYGSITETVAVPAR